MTQRNPEGTLQSDLDALAEVFEAEDRQDRRAEAQRRREGLPEPERDIRAFPASQTVERLPEPEARVSEC